MCTGASQITYLLCIPQRGFVAGVAHKQLDLRLFEGAFCPLDALLLDGIHTEVAGVAEVVVVVVQFNLCESRYDLGCESNMSMDAGAYLSTRSPAVSLMIQGIPPRSIRTSTTSRVVPAMGDTMAAGRLVWPSQMDQSNGPVK